LVYDPTFWHEHLHTVWEQSEDYTATTQLTCDDTLGMGRFGLNHETIAEENDLELMAATFFRVPTGPATKRILCEYNTCLTDPFPNPESRGAIDGINSGDSICSEERIILANLLEK